MNSQIFYYILSCTLSIFLIFFIVSVGKLKTDYSAKLVKSMSAGFLVIPIYTLYVFSNNFTVSSICRSIYYAANSWLAYYFLSFAVDYGKFKENPKVKIVLKVLFWLTIFDSLFVLSNIFTEFIFQLRLYYSQTGAFYFWHCINKDPIIVHRIIVYGLVTAGMATIIVDSKKAPYYYKMRYFGILMGYLLVMIVHAACLIFDINYDYSVMLYSLMGAFICYYIAYSTPHQMIGQSLLNFNDTINDIILYFDEKGKCIFANRKAQAHFRKDGIFDDKGAENERIQILQKFVKNQRGKILFSDTKFVSGELHDFEGEYEDIFNGGILVGSYILLRDNTETLRHYRQQKFLTTHDALTGIFNREEFFNKVDELLRTQNDVTRLMLCFNIRDFKLTNGIFGSEAGDEILRKHAQMLQSLAHGDDVYGRIGDDKFALFTRSALFNPKIIEEALKNLQKITKTETFHLRNEVGVYEVVGGTENAQLIYDKALTAIEHKTDNGKIFYFYNPEIMNNQVEEHNLTNSFDRSFKNHDFKLLLQPLLNKEKITVGAEVLSVWNHPQKGKIFSQDYDSVLEKYGFADRLNDFLWGEAVKTLKTWESGKSQKIKLLLKVPGTDIFYTKLYDRISLLIEKYGVNPENLVFEFSEEAISRDFKAINALFEKLQSIDVKILINQFGNGYSSLNLLKDIHCDYIKIDSRFIKKTEDAGRAGKILDFILKLAELKKVTVLINGIDDESEFNRLKNSTIRAFQGKYCSEGSLAEDFKWSL